MDFCAICFLTQTYLYLKFYVIDFVQKWKYFITIYAEKFTHLEYVSLETRTYSSPNLVYNFFI